MHSNVYVYAYIANIILYHKIIKINFICRSKVWPVASNISMSVDTSLKHLLKLLSVLCNEASVVKHLHAVYYKTLLLF